MDSAVTGRNQEAWLWEMRDQPAQPSEPLTPLRPDLGPYLCVQAVPGEGDRSLAGMHFTDWPAVSRWIAGLAAPQGVVTPELAARARELGSRWPDSLARIGGLARYVQGLNYVSIALNIGRGWGYRPLEAGTVLRAGYGDCKDKANLLCTLLRAGGHEAWPLLVFSGDRDRIDTAWASPHQFNHCVVAIRMPGSYHGPLIDEGRRGRLAAFDPTDPLTVFGDLPLDQQGSWGLLALPAEGGLVRLPVQPPEANRTERHIDATLTAAGGLGATVVARSEGQAAREERDVRRRNNRADYRAVLEAWLPVQGGSVAIRSWSSLEDTATGRYELKIDYESPSFARRVGPDLLAFRSALISPRQSWMPSDTARTMPIAVPAQCVVETVSVRLPDEFALENRPGDLHVANDLGRLDATWEERGSTVHMIRSWELRPITVGPERWPDVCALFGAMRASNEATVVLARR